ncbi:MAG: response regulator [Lentisphaerae bacterium]|nr:response regulator [Lentisphaerota bacterium]
MKQDMRAKRTILLVDDDMSLLQTLDDFLSYEGYQVETAESGERALAKLRRINPDIIILDMSMPGMGGVGFLDRITQPDGSTRFPVLVLTARAAMAEYFASRQIDGFLSKPCNPEDLLNEVSRIIFLRSGDSAPGGNAALDPVAASHARRAVLAEGDAALAASLSVDLQRVGFQVEAVRTGPAALELAIVSKPDVVILRMELDGMNASEIVSTLRRIPNLRCLPIVVYGIAAPDALIEHVAMLDLSEIAAIKDVSADKIINAALAVTVKR